MSDPLPEPPAKEEEPEQSEDEAEGPGRELGYVPVGFEPMTMGSDDEAEAYFEPLDSDEDFGPSESKGGAGAGAEEVEEVEEAEEAEEEDPDVALRAATHAADALGFTEMAHRVAVDLSLNTRQAELLALRLDRDYTMTLARQAARDAGEVAEGKDAMSPVLAASIAAARAAAPPAHADPGIAAAMAAAAAAGLTIPPEVMALMESQSDMVEAPPDEPEEPEYWPTEEEVNPPQPEPEVRPVSPVGASRADEIRGALQGFSLSVPNAQALDRAVSQRLAAPQAPQAAQTQGWATFE